MSDKQKIPKGYKQTEVGEIPEDWEVKAIGEVVFPNNAKYNPLSEDKDYPCIELEHVSQGTGTLLGTIPAKNQKSMKNKFNKGDILFGKLRPYLEKYLLPNFDGTCSSEFWVFKPVNESIYNFYIFYYVQSHIFIQIANSTTGTKMPRADWKLVKESPIPLPPTLEEQKAIAGVLGDMDPIAKV